MADPTDEYVSSPSDPHPLRSRFGESAAWAQDVAAQQAQYILVATTNFLTTMTTLLISAMGLATALAWNKAISDWLPTVKMFKLHDPLVREFAYAVGITLIAVLTISLLTVVNRRIKKEKQAPTVASASPAAPTKDT